MSRLTIIIERGAEYRRCGQWFNLFGQEVTDPSSWSSGSDW